MLKFKSNEAKEAYNLLIAGGSDEPLDAYCERHHIIPRSMGGTDDAWNLVYLTAGEHLYAHYWLWVGTGDQGMGNAYFQMSNSRWAKYEDTPEITDAMIEAYETAKIVSAKSHSKNISGKNHPMYGRKHTSETRKKMREASLGENNHRYGKKVSNETLQKMREAKLGENNPGYGNTFRAKRVRHTFRGETEEWPSAVAAAKDFSLSSVTISRLARNNKRGFSYV